MKDYRDMLSSLKDKVVDAAGKAVSDEMRDKVAGAAQAVGERAKYASRMTRLTVDCNAELERVKRTYTEIGRLYYEQAKDAPEGFFAPLFAQAEEICGRIAAKEDEINALKADIAAATGCDEADIDVEIGEFDDFDNIVDATEDDGKNE